MLQGKGNIVSMVPTTDHCSFILSVWCSHHCPQHPGKALALCVDPFQGDFSSWLCRRVANILLTKLAAAIII